MTLRALGAHASFASVHNSRTLPESGSSRATRRLGLSSHMVSGLKIGCGDAKRHFGNRFRVREGGLRRSSAVPDDQEK